MPRWLARAGRIAAVALGAWIAITSAIGIAVGVHASEGWLAILYGGLGVSMGIAGIAGVGMTGALRGALLGWFLAGIASRAILEGDLYFVFISVPIAIGLLSALTFELIRGPSVARSLSAVAGGGLAVLALIVLAIVAPSLPVICQSFLGPGRSVTIFLYPGNIPPFDAVERNYIDRCFPGPRLL
jgi:hypothetical protein